MISVSGLKYKELWIYLKPGNLPVSIFFLIIVKLYKVEALCFLTKCVGESNTQRWEGWSHGYESHEPEVVVWHQHCRKGTNNVNNVGQV